MTAFPDAFAGPHRMIAEEERDRLLLDAPVGAAVMIGADLVYRLVNAIYADVSGRQAQDMVGKPFAAVFRELVCAPVHARFLALLRHELRNPLAPVVSVGSR